jgi:arabinoxylan arabinofuranohydrolase
MSHPLERRWPLRNINLPRISKDGRDSEPLACIEIRFSNVWVEYSSGINIPDGIHALYFVYKGTGHASIASFTLE